MNKRAGQGSGPGAPPHATTSGIPQSSADIAADQRMASPARLPSVDPLTHLLTPLARDHLNH